MNRTDAIRELRSAAEDLPAKAASARAAINQMRRKAQDLTVQASGRARGEIARRRTTAATTLESLADALRPDQDARARRKALAIAGGSGVALAAAVGLGVALGFVLSRAMKKRAEQRIAASRSESASIPDVAPADLTAAGLDL
jgi:hypothetical protein